MAKNKVYIDVVVDDKGTTKRVAVNAKKLGLALEETAKSARTADRNLKGASQQSANGTKNFSKMAQGISGTLVPAYATLAANIFAISAAFGFLKESADFRVIQEAQVAFSSATGVGLKSLTADIKQATGGLVGFKEAASGAAIGVAAGLSTGQIEKFAKGAKDVSLILGRDVTDSFNRLIRGVTKAEPELLDELGIILRLETATEKYAASLKKNAKELTLFEKSQAVAVEVQEQLDQKYSTVAASVELQANAVAQLGIAFEEVIIPLREFISALAEPTALFLKENIKALTGVLVLFAVPLIRSIIPNLEEWGRASREAALEASAAYENAKKEIDELRIAQEKLNKSSPLKGAQEALKGVDSKSPGVKAIQAGKFEQVTPRQVNSLLAAAERGKGAVTQMSNEMKVKYIAALREMKTSTDVQMGRVERKFRQTVNKIKLGAAKASAAWQLGMSKIKSASAVAAKGIDKAFKAISVVGFALLIKDLGVSIAEYFGIIGQNQAITDLSAKFEQLERDLNNTSKEFEKFAEIQTKFFEKSGGKVSLESVAALGGFASSSVSTLSSVADSFAELNSLQEKGLNTQANFFAETVLGYEDLEAAQEGLKAKAKSTATLLVKGLKAAKVETQELGPEFLSLAEKFAASEGLLSPKDLERFRELGVLFEKLQGKANTLLQNNIAINQEYDKTIQGITQFDTKVGGIIRNIEAQIQLEKEVNTENSERLATYDKQLVVLKQIRDAEIKFANDQKRLEFARTKLLIGKTALQKEEIERNLKIEGIEIKRQQLINDISIAEAAGVERDQAKIDSLNIQLGILNAQEESLIRQGDYAAQLADTLSQSFETSLQKGIADAIKGNETSFKDLMLNIAQSVLNALADTLAKQITQSLFNIDNPEAKIKTAMIEAADYHGTVIRAAVQGAPQPVNTSPSSPGGGIEGGTAQSVGIMERLFGRKTTGKVSVEGPDGVYAESSITRRTGGIFSGFINAFSDVFDKNVEGGFLKKMGAVFQEGGSLFADLFKSLPQLLGSLFGGMGGGGGGGLFGTIASLFFANGGIAKGGFRSAAYARGGIATQPTIGLVGEGRHNEAIVPLPDGKSIPVTMSGMGQQNNVTVNVNIDGNGNASQEEQGTGASNLGRAVAAAVQAELMNQKRSGGILSPYGVA